MSTITGSPLITPDLRKVAELRQKGILVWTKANAHEMPQELQDFCKNRLPGIIDRVKQSENLEIQPFRIGKIDYVVCDQLSNVGNLRIDLCLLSLQGSRIFIAYDSKLHDYKITYRPGLDAFELAAGTPEYDLVKQVEAAESAPRFLRTLHELHAAENSAAS